MKPGPASALQHVSRWPRVSTVCSHAFVVRTRRSNGRGQGQLVTSLQTLQTHGKDAKDRLPELPSAGATDQQQQPDRSQLHLPFRTSLECCSSVRRDFATLVVLKPRVASQRGSSASNRKQFEL